MNVQTYFSTWWNCAANRERREVSSRSRRPIRESFSFLRRHWIQTLQRSGVRRKAKGDWTLCQSSVTSVAANWNRGTKSKTRKRRCRGHRRWRETARNFPVRLLVGVVKIVSVVRAQNPANLLRDDATMRHLNRVHKCGLFWICFQLDPKLYNFFFSTFEIKFYLHKYKI